MINIRCDATTRRIETSLTSDEYRSNRRYKFDHLEEHDWDYLVGILRAIEVAGYVLSTYRDFLQYLQSQMVGKIMDASAYMVVGGLINDMVMINDTEIMVTG